MPLIKRSTFAFSASSACSNDAVAGTSTIWGWRCPTGADHGLVAVSHPGGIQLAVGAGAAPFWEAWDRFEQAAESTVTA